MGPVTACFFFSYFSLLQWEYTMPAPPLDFWKHIMFTFISSQLESNFPWDESYLHIWLRWYLDETLKLMMEWLRLRGYWDRVDIIYIWEGHVGGSRLQCCGLNPCVQCLSNFVCSKMIALWDTAIWGKTPFNFVMKGISACFVNFSWGHVHNCILANDRPQCESTSIHLIKSRSLSGQGVVYQSVVTSEHLQCW